MKQLRMALWSVLLPLLPKCQDYRCVPACLVYAGLESRDGGQHFVHAMQTFPQLSLLTICSLQISLAPGPQDSSHQPSSMTRHVRSNQKLNHAGHTAKEIGPR